MFVTKNVPSFYTFNLKKKKKNIDTSLDIDVPLNLNSTAVPYYFDFSEILTIDFFPFSLWPTRIELRKLGL